MKIPILAAVLRPAAGGIAHSAGSVRHVAYFPLRNGAEVVFRAFAALALLVLLRGVLRSHV